MRGSVDALQAGQDRCLVLQDKDIAKSQAGAPWCIGLHLYVGQKARYDAVGVGSFTRAPVLAL